MTPLASTGKSAGAGRVDEPLLPEFSSGGHGASVCGAVFNVSTSIIGAGIMSIPAAMRVLGVLPALLLIAAVAALSDSCVEFMLRYTGRDSGPPSYAGIMGDAFGTAGAKALNVCIAFTTTGTLVVYLIIIGDVLSGSAGAGDEHAGVLRELFGAQWWTARELVILVTAVVVLLPLVLRRRVDSLKFTSAVSILLAVVFMLINLGIAVYTLFSGTAKMPRMLPDFSRLSSPFELFTAVPIIVVAFTFHFNVHPIREELSKTSDMKAAVRISLILCAAIYAAVGFFGFLLFGDATMADVLANFDRSSGAGVPQALNDAARLSYALHLVLVFPLLHFSLRVNVDELLFPGRRSLATDTRRFVALTAVLMAVLYALAIAIPSIWTLFEYSGSTFAVCISLIFPGAIVLRHAIRSRRDSKEEGQGIGGDDDHSGRDHEQHRHRFQRHELHERQGGRGPCRSYVARGILVCCPTASRFKGCCPCSVPLFYHSEKTIGPHQLNGATTNRKPDFFLVVSPSYTKST